MIVRDRILAYLRDHPEGADDDALAIALGLAQRQRANQECRRLEQHGIIERRRVEGKIRNFLGQVQQAEAAEPEDQAPDSILRGPQQKWHWEGNVQDALVRYLVGSGYKITRVADTASRETGKDIIAVAQDGKDIWLSVKGYPDGTSRTNPATQARHWFVAAFYDLFAWHEENPTVALGVGLPDFPTYRNMSRRVASGLQWVGASLFWVFQDGHVKEQTLR